MFSRDNVLSNAPVSPEDLSAFADGALPQARARTVAHFLRCNRESAQSVYQYWCQDADLYAQFSATGCSGKSSGKSSGECSGEHFGNGIDEMSGGQEYCEQPRAGSRTSFLWQGVAASILLSIGVLIGAVTNFSPAAGGGDPSAPIDIAVMPAEELPVAAVMVSKVGKALPEVPGVETQGVGSPVKAPANIATLAPEPALSVPEPRLELTEPNTLPKSQLASPQIQTFHFTGANGAQLTLVKSRTSSVDQEGQPMSESGVVQWVQSGSLLTLSGSLDPADLLLVAMELHERQPSRHPVGTADTGLQKVPVSPADQRAIFSSPEATVSPDALRNL